MKICDAPNESSIGRISECFVNIYSLGALANLLRGIQSKGGLYHVYASHLLGPHLSGALTTIHIGMAAPAAVIVVLIVWRRH
ncbi:MAG: hypothetical protein ACFFFC_16080 [Candidatus Thorarchaeota archaeon]